MGCGLSMSRLISLMAVSWSLGLGEFEGVLELALPVAVGRECEAFGHLALGVELQQLVRHVAHFGLDAGLGAGPGGAAHAVERRLGFARAAEALHQVHARQRHVELGAAGVFEQHVVALGFALRDLAQAQELRHAVLRVDHVIAGLEIDQVGRKSAPARTCDDGARATSSEVSKRSSEPNTTSFESWNAVPRRISPLTR